jgi:S1-C subfamily serine protease
MQQSKSSYVWFAVRWTLLGALLASLVMNATSCCTAEKRPSLPLSTEDLLASVWSIRNTSEHVHGTCFPVMCVPTRGGYKVGVLTAAHIVSVHDAGFYKVVIPGLDIEMACSRIMGVNHESDTALLLIHSAEPVEVFSMSFEPVHWGEPLIAIGRPGDMGTWITAGFASGADRMSCDIAPGCSGGPVLRVSDHTVVGVNSATLTNMFNTYTFAALYGPIVNQTWIVEELAKEALNN